MQIVRIRLRKPRRVFPFLCDDLALSRNAPCVVESDRGLEWGVCVLPPEPCPTAMEARFPYRVLREATAEDHDTEARLEEEEHESKAICAEKIRSRQLPMKLVDVEYTFDKKKAVFYFTAEERVDFRELVRDLAHELRARIELRHIQVRDEAKMVGGIGSCGRELCCASWLNEFKPISMRMAKRQNLSLNPSKISGQCGRLLCCLSYENDLYESAKRKAKQKKAEETVEGDEFSDEGSVEEEALLELDADAAALEAAERREREREEAVWAVAATPSATMPDDESPSRHDSNDPQRKRRRGRRKERPRNGGDRG